MDLFSMQQTISERLLKSSLPRALAGGTATREQYRAYVVDVYHYARHSSQVIGMSATRLVLSHPKMAAYLFQHAEEELGHDVWAASDLRDLGMSESQIAASAPSDPCLQMLGLEYLYAAHLNPVGLFGWMFALESLGAKVGGSIALMLNKTLSLECKALQFLTGHAEADTTHAADLISVISSEAKASEDITVIERMAFLSTDLYVRILDAAAASGPAGKRHEQRS